jgi:signal transduction histidine kinase
VRTDAAAPRLPWPGDLHWRAVDLLVAAALLVASVGGAVGRTPQFPAPAWLIVGAAALVAAPVAVRRIWPLPAFWTTLAANTVVAALGVGGDPAVLVAVTLYTVAATRPARQAVAPLVLALGAATASEAMTLLPAQPSLLLQTRLTLIAASALTLAAAWTLGVAAHTQRAFAARAAEQRVERARTDERLRIARELHDVITHSITLITVKAGVAHHLIDSRPDEARRALSLIETTGRTTLTELRHMLGVLRTHTPSPRDGAPIPHVAGAAAPVDRAPLPGLADLAALADRARDVDVDVTLAICGATDLPEGVAVTTYRIVQEALTNVVKHAAPTRCDVDIDITATEITVTVIDYGAGSRPAPNPDGHGLIGMRERVVLYAGQFDAGPIDRGFQVTARLPLTTDTTT